MKIKYKINKSYETLLRINIFENRKSDDDQ